MTDRELVHAKICAIGACRHGLETRDWAVVEYGISELRKLGADAVAGFYQRRLSAERPA